MSALTITYTLTNGTNADATQVEQDLTDIVNYVNASTVRTDGANAMTGKLTLDGTDPSNAAHAVNKSYLDGAHVIATGGVSQTFTSSTNNVVKFSTEVRDTANAFDPTTGIFLSPKAGLYLVTFTSAFDQSVDAIIRQGVIFDGVAYELDKFVPIEVNDINEAAKVSSSMVGYVGASKNITAYINPSVTQTSVTMNIPVISIAWLHG